MLRFAETKVVKEEFHSAKKTLNIFDVNVENLKKNLNENLKKY